MVKNNATFKHSTPFYQEILRPLIYDLRKSPLVAGFKIAIAGRLTRKERAAYMLRNKGILTFARKTLHIDYTADHKIMRFGLVGIKTWVNLRKSKPNFYSMEYISMWWDGIKNLISKKKNNIIDTTKTIAEKGVPEVSTEISPETPKSTEKEPDVVLTSGFKPTIPEPLPKSAIKDDLVLKPKTIIPKELEKQLENLKETTSNPISTKQQQEFAYSESFQKKLDNAYNEIKKITFNDKQSEIFSDFNAAYNYDIRLPFKDIKNDLVFSHEHIDSIALENIIKEVLCLIIIAKYYPNSETLCLATLSYYYMDSNFEVRTRLLQLFLEKNKIFNRNMTISTETLIKCSPYYTKNRLDLPELMYDDLKPYMLIDFNQLKLSFLDGYRIAEILGTIQFNTLYPNAPIYPYKNEKNVPFALREKYGLTTTSQVNPDLVEIIEREITPEKAAEIKKQKEAENAIKIKQEENAIKIKQENEESYRRYQEYDAYQAYRKNKEEIEKKETNLNNTENEALSLTDLAWSVIASDKNKLIIERNNKLIEIIFTNKDIKNVVCAENGLYTYQGYTCNLLFLTPQEDSQIFYNNVIQTYIQGLRKLHLYGKLKHQRDDCIGELVEISNYTTAEALTRVLIKYKHIICDIDEIMPSFYILVLKVGIIKNRNDLPTFETLQKYIYENSPDHANCSRLFIRELSTNFQDVLDYAHDNN